MITSSLTHICITRPQSVNSSFFQIVWFMSAWPGIILCMHPGNERRRYTVYLILEIWQMTRWCILDAAAASSPDRSMLGDTGLKPVRRNTVINNEVYSQCISSYWRVIAVWISICSSKIVFSQSFFSQMNHSNFNELQRLNVFIIENQCLE